MTPTEKAVEAMARAYCIDRGLNPDYRWTTFRGDFETDHVQWAEFSNDMQRALTALISLYPGIASVIEGTGVVVPKEPTEAMYAEACNPTSLFKYTKPEERGGKIPLLPALHYRAMLAAAEKPHD